MDKVSYILSLEAKPTLFKSNTLLFSFIYCLSPAQGTRLLWESITNDRFDLRNMALRKACEDISIKCDESHKKLVRDLISCIENLDDRKKQSCGYCLSSICKGAPIQVRTRIEKFFLESESIRMRRRGYKSLSRNYRKSAFSLVDKTWKRYQDPECAALIMNNFPISYLIDNRTVLVDILPEHWQVARLYIRIYKKSPELLEELLSHDAISFCYALVKLNKKLSEELAFRIFQENLANERIGLLIWAFGRLGLWHVLEHVKFRQTELTKAQISSLRKKHEMMSSKKQSKEKS